MRYYELMMVVAPQIEEEEITAALDRVNHYVSERGGVVVRQERWGRQRRLAYPIKNHNEGTYVLTHLELEPETTQGLEASILLSTDVLRHLLVKIDAIPEVKEPPQQAAAEAVATDEPATPAEDQAAVAEDEPTTPAEDQAAVAEDEPTTPAEDQVAVAEDEPETPAEDQVAVVEDEPAAPAEDQVAVVEDEPETPAEDQEPQKEKKE